MSCNMTRWLTHVSSILTTRTVLIKLLMWWPAWLLQWICALFLTPSSFLYKKMLMWVHRVRKPTHSTSAPTHSLTHSLCKSSTHTHTHAHTQIQCMRAERAFRPSFIAVKAVHTSLLLPSSPLPHAGISDFGLVFPPRCSAVGVVVDNNNKAASLRCSVTPHGPERKTRASRRAAARGSFSSSFSCVV